MSVALLLDHERRSGGDTGALSFLDGLHPKQRTAVEDRSRFNAALCGRRSGKTWGLACMLLATAEANPNEMSVYVALTKNHARKDLGKAILRIQKAYGVQGRLGEQDGQLHWIHHNGHRIWLAGCKHVGESEKFRGDYYCRVVIDEAASYPLGMLEYLVDDVLSWALIDKQAPLTITGTPGALPVGYFHDVTVGTDTVEKWPVHSWTMFDNPHIPDPPGELAMRLKRTGETVETPAIQREVFGRWARDESAIVYPYVASRNVCWEVPRDCDHWVLSLDLGHDDDTTFTISGSRRGSGKVWFLKSYGIAEMTTGARAAEVRRCEMYLREFTGNPSASFATIVVDQGGLGKSICHDMATDHGINCVPAEKSSKASAIRNLQDGLRSGRVLVYSPGCSQLIGEWQILPWNLTRTDHHPEFADHCSDGALYGYRAHPSYEKWDEEKPPPGTPEAFNAEMEEYRARLIKQAMKDKAAQSRALLAKLGSGRRYS